MSPADLPPPPVPAAHRSAATVAPDPLTAQQAHLAGIRWTPPPAGGRRPLVAVLDTGVDAAAPDLAGVVLTAAGRSFLPGRRDPGLDPDGHGTHVAGIIAARSGNGVGGSGVANARILPVTIADARGRTTTSALVRGIRYASARGARVINISFGGSGFSRAEQEAIDVATRRGALVVAAVGNTGGRGGGPGYPGAYRHVLAVAALGADGRAMPLSERGDQVALAAPGQDVASVAAGADAGSLAVRSGTSMASAVVAGAAARLIARRPRLNAQQVRAVLESTASEVPPRGSDSATGAGALDLAAALAARPPVPGDPEPNDEISLAARTPPLLGPRGRDANGRRGRTGSWSDPRDHHRLVLRAGQAVTARLRAPRAGRADLDLLLWRPGTPSGSRSAAVARRWLVAASLGPRSSESVSAIAPVSGVYSLEVRGVGGRESRGGGSVEYVLTATRDDSVTSTGFVGPARASRMGGS